MVPLRIIGSSIRYLDGDGAEVELVNDGIHHRDETVTGLGDPMLLGAAAFGLGAWRLTARAGLTIPLGRTEENPFTLGDLGLAHQHLQMGTGTVNPVIAAELARAWGAWRGGVFALTQQVVYEGGKGYQAGDRYAVGLAVGRKLGARWTVRGSVDALAETAERWDGTSPTDDGNRGRFDLIFGAGGAWAATERLGLELAIKLPAITYAVGGQLSMPVIVELGASWRFGAAAPARAKDDHGHDHGDGDGHDHGDGDGDGHDHGEGRPVVPPAPSDARGLDVADVGAPGEAFELVPVAGKLTIFDFWAEWCVPCKALEPMLLELARAHPGAIAIRRVDTSDWGSPATARHLTPKGFGLPHLKVFGPDGRLVLERSSGDGGLEALVEAVRALLLAAPRPTAQP